MKGLKELQCCTYFVVFRPSKLPSLTIYIGYSANLLVPGPSWGRLGFSIDAQYIFSWLKAESQIGWRFTIGSLSSTCIPLSGGSPLASVSSSSSATATAATCHTALEAPPCGARSDCSDTLQLHSCHHYQPPYPLFAFLIAVDFVLLTEIYALKLLNLGHWCGLL